MSYAITALPQIEGISIENGVHKGDLQKLMSFFIYSFIFIKFPHENFIAFFLVFKTILFIKLILKGFTYFIVIISRVF